MDSFLKQKHKIYVKTSCKSNSKNVWVRNFTLFLLLLLSLSLCMCVGYIFSIKSV